MKYLALTRMERETLWTDLEAMPGFLLDRFGTLSAGDAARPGPGGAFSPVEQCWHLADLEREGYGVRIRRLLAETEPLLPDFDGARAAEERQYRSRSLVDGLQAFREARAANLSRLRALDATQWARGGTQEGVGRVALCDLPHMMAEHDASHRAEIAAWAEGQRH
jgi:hypothetical protein